MQYITLLEPTISLVVVLLITFSIALYFKHRSGTTYGIKNKIYSILTGKDKFEDQAFENLWLQNRDIERFNVIFNLNATCKEDVFKFVKWSKRYSIDTRKLTSISKYFNIRTLKIKSPDKAYITFKILISLIFYFSSLLFLEISGSDYALINVKHGNKLVWINQSSAKPFTLGSLFSEHDAWTLYPESCDPEKYDLSKIAKHINYKLKTVKVICDTLVNEKDRLFVSNELNERKKYLILGIIFLLVAFELFRRIYRSLSAYRMKAHFLERFKEYRKRRSLLAIIPNVETESDSS